MRSLRVCGSLVSASTCRRFRRFSRRFFIGSFRFRRSRVSPAPVPASTSGGFRAFAPRFPLAAFRLQRAFCRSSLQRFSRRLLLRVAAAAFLQVFVGASFGASFVFVASALCLLFSWPRVRSRARKSPTSKRTRRCTRPPTAPFVPLSASGGG